MSVGVTTDQKQTKQTVFKKKAAIL